VKEITLVASGIETVSNLGVVWVRLITADRESGMKWRVMVALTGSDCIVRLHEASAGGTNTTECSAGTVGLTLADGKRTLAGLQDHLVRAQAEEYCRQRRACSHCGSQRPVKDVRARRLLPGNLEFRARLQPHNAYIWQAGMSAKGRIPDTAPASQKAPPDSERRLQMAVAHRCPTEIGDDGSGQRHVVQLTWRYQPRSDNFAVIELQFGRAAQPQFKEMHPVSSSIPDA
jgi:hypothetical protein